MDLDHALEIADESLAGGYNSMHDQALHFLAAEVRRRASPASVPEGMELSAPTILPDGSGFGILSLPLPKGHWLYAEREYEEDVIEPTDLPAPILTHALRQQVIDAIRYAVRSATNCGKEDDFDPDALVQNAVYALCGPYGAVAPTPPVSEDRWQPIETAPKDGRPVWVRGNDWGEDAGPNHYGWAYFDSGKWMWPAPVAEGGEAVRCNDALKGE